MVFPCTPTFAVHHVVHLCGCGVGLSGHGGTGGLELVGGWMVDHVVHLCGCGVGLSRVEHG